ncbi:MAG: hypothetical protein PUD52_01600 [Prevotella sp.]|nr:hypothetical protein [Prevotella sp.]
MTHLPLASKYYLYRSYIEGRLLGEVWVSHPHSYMEPVDFT